MNVSISWFEIPVKDFDRARAFYETIFDAKLRDLESPMPGGKMAAFLSNNGADMNGAIVLMEDFEVSPNHTGPTLYLFTGQDCAIPASRVEAAGGKLLSEKMDIGDYGFVILFEDTEGNRIGLHSND